MAENCNEKINTHFYCFDILRVIAIYAVFLVHGGCSVVKDNVVVYAITLFLYTFSRIGVPLFFMISGALLLDKEENCRKILLFRVVRYLIVILMFSFAQYVLLGGDPASETFGNWRGRDLALISERGLVDFLTTFLKYIYSKPIIIQYWFLYAYIGFLLLLPILRPAYKAMNYDVCKYLVIGIFATTVLFPEFQNILGLGNINISLTVFENIVAYPLVGAYLFNNCSDEKIGKYFSKRSMIFVLLFYLINTLIYVVENNVWGTEYFNPGQYSIMYAIFVFALTCCKGREISRPIPLVSAIATATFGIYLSEDILHAIQRPLFEWYYQYMSDTMAYCLKNVISILIGTAIFYLLKKNSLVRKIV